MRNIQLESGTILTGGEVQEAVQEFALAYGVNQALFLVAEALTRIAESKANYSPEAGAQVQELAFSTEKLAQTAQRSGL